MLNKSQTNLWFSYVHTLKYIIKTENFESFIWFYVIQTSLHCHTKEETVYIFNYILNKISNVWMSMYGNVNDHYVIMGTKTYNHRGKSLK